MNSFLINGSPDTSNGIHSSLLDSLEKGLREAGSEINRVNAYELDVNPCTSCFSCWKGTPGVCSQKDDMEPVLAQVAESDLMVLATPVYLDGMTGPLKIVIDRLLPLLMGRVELRDGRMRHLVRDGVKRGSVMLVSASGFSELDTFYPLVTHIKAISRNLGRDYVGGILLPSGWYIRRQRELWSRVYQMITSTGYDLGKNGGFEDLTSEITSMISRETVIEHLNLAYGKYE